MTKIEERKNPDINHIGRKNVSSLNSLNGPAFSFVYILIHGREEQVLV